MSIDPRRLLGLAFASADLLVELQSGRVRLALGAAQKVMGKSEVGLTGQAWSELFHPDDRPLMEAMLSCADDGIRRGPVVLRLAGTEERCVRVILRALPENDGRVSCAVTAAQSAGPPLTADSLQPRESFDDIAQGLFEAARVTGLELELAMVEFAGLGAMREGLTPSEAQALDVRVASAVRAESHGGSAATRLSPDRFALLRQRDDRPENMVKRLTKMVSAEADAHLVPLESGGGSSRALRALRYALDDFLREGLKDMPPMTLSEAMNRSVKRTLARAGALGVAVSQRRFTLAYQPVVSLATGLAHHHEALVRFEDGGSPFALIRMAEEFDLIEELDHAIVEQAVKKLANDQERKLRLAVNVSGQTIGNESFVDHVSRLLAKFDEAKGRLIFEITETRAIDNLAVANQHIQALRGMGSLVCLDDFGAGSSSFAYLQQLQLDIVKIDGRYVRELADNGRDGALVRRLVELCRDLKIRTVAEMVETVEVEEIVRAAGVDFAQGWLYGKPADKPAPALRPSAPVKAVARRAGASDSWG
ncbi:EAL domain-containing protein [Caulobacter sp.]|uniref:EAL domain-containing protein n=1 Tax=Caulobacter sp. TaxID=78 RepID=UPI001B2F688F|nr:EAL domain-containing protein [Caulobacter sp.]MBO9546388.1 EAL domain-containing protein [Caulobacter sp.]